MTKIKYISNSLKHLRKILVHKWWVFYYCCKVGRPWTGLKHDLSKFSPVEFFESVKYYMGTSSPIDECKRQNGYSLAWQNHKGKNAHHYEHWTDNYDTGLTSIEMPYKYAVEMFCDYMGAARAYLGKEFSYEKELTWWRQKRLAANTMHAATKTFIDICFSYCVAFNTFPNKKELKVIYQDAHSKHN